MKKKTLTCGEIPYRINDNRKQKGCDEEKALFPPVAESRWLVEIGTENKGETHFGADIRNSQNARKYGCPGAPLSAKRLLDLTKLGQFGQFGWYRAVNPRPKHVGGVF